MTNGFRGLLVGGGEPIYVKLKEVEKLAVRHFKGAKNHRVKKVIKSKNDFSKSCPKFCKLGDEFFYFDEISKMRLLRRKNDILIMYIIYIINHAFLALEPPKIKILTKKIMAMLKYPREII